MILAVARGIAALAILVAPAPAVPESRSSDSRGPPIAAGSRFPFAEFGPPIILLEAERPEHAADRRCCGLLAEALGAQGIRCADGEEARGRRRSLADRGAESGIPAARLRAGLDRPDVDFVVRVSHAERDVGAVAAYGIQIAARECTLSAVVIRTPDQAAMEVAPASAVARSASPSAASREAEASAVRLAAEHVAGAIRSDWLDLLEGRRAGFIEILPLDETDALRFAETIERTGARILENRPGIRTLVEVPAGDPGKVAEALGAGEVLQRRPGYMLVASTPPPPTWAWIAGAAVLGLVAVLSTVTVGIRRRSAARGANGPVIPH